MSIVSPMNTQLYNGMWLKLERFCRGLTEKYKDVYVVSGSLVLAEKSEKDDKMFVKYEIIGFNTIVPTHYYKIIMALDNVGVYHTRTIMLKNDQVEDAPLDKFTVDVGMVEERSGCRFFSHLQNAQIRTLKF